MTGGNRFDPLSTRTELLALGIDSGRFLKFAYRPWDDRSLYWHPRTKLLDEKRERLVRGSDVADFYLVSRSKAERSREGLPVWVVDSVPDHHVIRPSGAAFPRYRAEDSGGLLDGHDRVPNLSVAALEYMRSTSPGDISGLMFHVLSVTASPAYLETNSDALTQGWPRVPLPKTPALLAESIALGRRVASCSLLTERPQTTPFQAMGLGALASEVGQSLNPDDDLGVTARWGVAGQGGVTMPSTGKVVGRHYTDDERAGISECAVLLGLSRDQVVAVLGDTCFDVYLNDIAYWRCVPANVWQYTVGGYQVIKKWLSYRERVLLGRDLTVDEARYVTEMVRRIAALVLMGPDLDSNYKRVKADPWDWNGDS